LPEPAKGHATPQEKSHDASTYKKVAIKIFLGLSLCGAHCTPFGLFEYLRMPFGLRSAGSSFQLMMDRVLAGLDFCFWFLEDMVVASVTYEQHLNSLFHRLQEHGLVINLEKCEF
jgi:hypothetical protein